MINFFRISNNIKFGDYLHSDGAINEIASKDIIGICVIPRDFLPDRYARFMSLKQSRNNWRRIVINTDKKYKKRLPGKELNEQRWGFLGGYPPSLVSPYLFDGSFNPDFLIDLPHGNAFQDYKGYENTKKYKEKYGDSEDLDNAFSSCFKISPSYKKSDWYLPSIGELALLCKKLHMIDEKLVSAIIAGSLGAVLPNTFYWSSSEASTRHAWYIGIRTSSVYDDSKVHNFFIRSFLAL